MRKRTPKWKQLADEVRQRIEAGEFPDGRLPRVRELAARLEVRAGGTVDRAVSELEAAGVLIRRHGAGLYVRRRVLFDRRLVGEVFDENELALAGRLEPRGIFERATRTDDQVDVVPEYRQVPVPARVGVLLGVAPDTVALERTWTYATDGTPYQVARSYLTLETAAAAGLTGPECEVKGTSTQLQLIQAGFALQTVRRELEARMPSPEEMAALAIQPGTPVFERWGAIFPVGAGPALEAGYTVIPADRVRFVVDIDLVGRKAT